MKSHAGQNESYCLGDKCRLAVFILRVFRNGHIVRNWWNNPVQKFKKNDSLYEGISKSFRTESITKYALTAINTHWEATQRVMAAKLARPTHKIAIQLHLEAESCTFCSSRSRRPVRKLLDTPTYNWDIRKTFWFRLINFHEFELQVQ
jgi:hypothetical protein